MPNTVHPSIKADYQLGCQVTNQSKYLTDSLIDQSTLCLIAAVYWVVYFGRMFQTDRRMKVADDMTYSCIMSVLYADSH